LLKSPYPDLLMEMAVVRMASLAPVMDADELLRAIGNGGGGTASSSSSSGGTASSAASSGGSPASVPTRRMKVEGEVNATAPVRAPSPPPPAPARATAPLGAGIAQQSTSRDLPELRDFIRARRAALAGFMEQGASLAFADDVLSVNARNDIYIRYLSDNRATIAELASEFFARPIKVEVSSNGTVVAAATGKPSATSAATPPSNESTKISAPEVSRIEKSPPPEIEAKLTVVPDTPPISVDAAPKPIDISSKRRPGSPEDRQAVLQDPEMRRIFDELEARLVEVRITPDTEVGTKDVSASRKE
jgi:hypothetical protein